MVRFEVCIKCLGIVGYRLEVYRVYSLVLVGLGCGLLLLFILVVYGVFGWVVLCSLSMIVVEKLCVVVLVVSGVVFYVSFYVFYYVM